MKALSEFVVRVANLAEAEGRVAKRKVLEVVAATMVWLAAALIAVSGINTLLVAFYLFLRLELDAHWAMLIVALALLAISAGCVFLGKKLARGS